MTRREEPESATAIVWTYGTSATLHEIGKLKSVSKPDGYGEAYLYDSLAAPDGDLHRRRNELLRSPMRTTTRVPLIR